VAKIDESTWQRIVQCFYKTVIIELYCMNND